MLGKIFYWVILVLIIVGFVAFTVALFSDCHYQNSKVEVERYSVGCEITQMAYAEESISERHSEPTYRMGVRCDDFAHTFVITSEQFAGFKCGEIVEVEVIIYEFKDGKQTTEYNLVGIQK
jgi:hypothetical protein